MDYRRLQTCLAALILLVAGFSGQSGAQQTSLFGRAFNNGPELQAESMTTAARVLSQADQRVSQRQIQVRITYLMVDEANRAAIYQLLESQPIHVESQALPDKEPPTHFPRSGMDLQSKRTVSTTSCVATCVLTADRRNAILNQVSQSDGATIASSPSIILIDGNEGQMDEIVQRPFVVGLPPAKNKPDGSDQANTTLNANPTIQVIDEGNSIRVRASSRGDANVYLASELISKKIIGVESIKVFGVIDGAVLQRPIHQVESAVVAVELPLGQTVLIDPYISSEVEVSVERGVPILNKIPYINRSFRNTSMAIKKTNWMVLIQPLIESPAVAQATAVVAGDNR